MNRSAMIPRIHPDYLLDGARRGALPPEDWRRLGAHLAACPECAWEKAATDDFARERAALEGDGDAASFDLLLDGALARVCLDVEPSRGSPNGGLDGEPGRGSPKTSGAEANRSPRSLARWLGAAAMLAAAVAALLLPGAPGKRDGAHEDAPLASTEASLDAGALGTPSGGDS
jgi:anti-sigma factor RsiW